MLHKPQKARRLVPQWRSFASASQSSEFAAPPGAKHKPSTEKFSPDLVQRIARFRIEPNLVSAADLVESAVILGHDAEAIGAARIIMQDADAAPMVQAQAMRLLSRTGHSDELPSPPDPQIIKPATWRARARLNPDDAIAWVELAFNQVCNGHAENAAKSMRIALHIAPHSRYVLRAAARLFFQLGEFDRAHDLIRRNDATGGDPWLMAAEIALSRSAGRNPAFWKKGLSLLEAETLIPAQSTELAGAIGTQLIEDGGGRRGRKFIRQSQIAPTVNVVAQAEWISVQTGDNVVVPTAFRVAPKAWEALCMRAYFHEGHFQKALGCAQLWIREEKYNPVAYANAAAAANVLGDYSTAIEWAREGLKVGKDFRDLQNSLAYALACSGNLDQAEVIASRIHENPSEPNGLIASANLGLIALRRGHLEQGRSMYEKAISGFKKAGIPDLEASGLSYYALELARAGLTDEAEKRIEESKKITVGALKKPIEVVRDRAERMIQDARLRPEPAPTAAQ